MTILETTSTEYTNQVQDSVRIALPEPRLRLDQDEEWCLVETQDGWEEIRFHDYASLYEIPGLYERLFYDVLQCDSPATVRWALEDEIRKSGTSAEELRVLDLGAGNGMVGEELIAMGVETVVGIDVVESAARAAERDRPGVYTEFHITDITRLSEGQRARLHEFRFNCVTCVAALGFGDIPPQAFIEAFNLIELGGWIAFNIKEDFLSDSDGSGFSRLIRKMIKDGSLSIRHKKRYRHRLATSGKPLFYVCLVGVKSGDAGGDLVA